jgi:hypothetical protein
MWKCITIMSTLTTSDDKMEGLKKKRQIQKKNLTLGIKERTPCFNVKCNIIKIEE